MVLAALVLEGLLKPPRLAKSYSGRAFDVAMRCSAEA